MSQQRLEAFKGILRTKREHSGLSQRKIASKAGLTLRGYQNYEAGLGHPRVKQLIALCEALECTPNELLGY